MAFPKGLKRDFKKLEARRLRAIELLDRGVAQAEVARRVGVHRQSVCRWSELRSKGGTAILRHRRAGRKARLGLSEMKHLEKGLRQGPGKIGYATGVWTADRIADLIERQTGVRFHKDHIYRLLQRLGWSCQRPVGRALERNERAVGYWKQHRWPEIKKKLSAKGE